MNTLIILSNPRRDKTLWSLEEKETYRLFLLPEEEMKDLMPLIELAATNGFNTFSDKKPLPDPIKAACQIDLRFAPASLLDAAGEYMKYEITSIADAVLEGPIKIVEIPLKGSFTKS